LLVALHCIAMNLMSALGKSCERRGSAGCSPLPPGWTVTCETTSLSSSLSQAADALSLHRVCQDERGLQKTFVPLCLPRQCDCSSCSTARLVPSCSLRPSCYNFQRARPVLPRSVASVTDEQRKLLSTFGKVVRLSRFLRYRTAEDSYTLRKSSTKVKVLESNHIVNREPTQPLVLSPCPAARYSPQPAQALPCCEQA
jgi:hypothetical protein